MSSLYPFTQTFDRWNRVTEWRKTKMRAQHSKHQITYHSKSKMANSFCPNKMSLYIIRSWYHTLGSSSSFSRTKSTALQSPWHDIKQRQNLMDKSRNSFTETGSNQNQCHHKLPPLQISKSFQTPFCYHSDSTRDISTFLKIIKKNKKLPHYRVCNRVSMQNKWMENPFAFWLGMLAVQRHQQTISLSLSRYDCTPSQKSKTKWAEKSDREKVYGSWMSFIWIDRYSRV